MKTIIIPIWARLLLLLFIVSGCETVFPDTNKIITDPTEEKGVLEISFVYRIQSIPTHRVKRVDLSLAYTSDSLYQGSFFTSTNVSDVISKYRFYLKPGVYYYQATLVCLATGDSCSLAGFPGGQFGKWKDGGKVEVFKDQLTEVSTQFH